MSFWGNLPRGFADAPCAVAVTVGSELPTCLAEYAWLAGSWGERDQKACLGYKVSTNLDKLSEPVNSVTQHLRRCQKITGPRLDQGSLETLSERLQVVRKEAGQCLPCQRDSLLIPGVQTEGLFCPEKSHEACLH